MKKVSILLAATAMSSVAFAVKPEHKMASETIRSAEMSLTQQKAMKAEAINKGEKVSVNKIKFGAPAANDITLNSPLKNFSVGINLERRGYPSPFGLLPSKGTVTFSVDGDSFDDGIWTWNNGLVDPYHEDYTFNGLENVIELHAPSIIDDVVFTAPNGETASPLAVSYFAGAGLEYWGFENARECGATMYPLKEGGMTEVLFDYCIANTRDYTAGGAPIDWIETLKQDDSDVVENVALTSFYNFIPAMSSPYMFSRSWMWVNAEFTAATELTMTVLPVIDNVISNTPIAVGYAQVAKGATNSMIDFELFAVDEDGDEIDGALVINNQEIVLVIEGLNENPAIKQFQMVFGDGTNFSIPANGKAVNPWYNTAYAGIQYTLNGEQEYGVFRNPYNYYADDARTELWTSSNFYWMVDAEFPYVNNAADDTDVFNLTAPVEGGEIVAEVEAMYFNILALIDEGLMEYTTDDEWVSVTVEAADPTTGITPVKIDCQPLPEGITGRTAAIKFTGFAQDVTINVAQGDNSGVNEIEAVSADAVYYDLQGRKLNNAPEKGIYIVKEGNKVSKVIR